MNIRLATKEDLNEIIKIESICFPEAEAAKESDFQKRFDAFKENFIIAEDNGKIIGFINGCTTDLPELPDELYHNVQLHKKHGDYQTIFGLDVLPDYRRNGVAAQLMNYIIELSKERGKKGMVLTCKNHLIHYYEKFAFKHQGVSASEHGGAVWNDMVLIF